MEKDARNAVRACRCEHYRREGRFVMDFLGREREARSRKGMPRRPAHVGKRLEFEEAEWVEGGTRPVMTGRME